MSTLSPNILQTIKFDLDKREGIIRRAVYDGLGQMSKAETCDHLVATYFVVAHSESLNQVGQEISYHMTSGVRHAPAASLLDKCTGKVLDTGAFDRSGKVGLLRVAFPLKMLFHQDGSLYSTDILHITAGAGVFALTEHADIKLVNLNLPQEVLNLFPGPAYGAPGVRKLTNMGEKDIALGTILKPCTGITAQEEAEIISETAGNPLFIFIKEDENYLPAVGFAPLNERLKAASEAIRNIQDERGSKGLIYAPHVTSPPQLFMDNVKRVIDAGINGLMFSEYYIGGAVRAVREMTKSFSSPPVIYGHNGGITCRTRHIYREVLDLLARLDGVDLRQTAPLIQGLGLLRPMGLEWRQCERILSEPIADHAPVMMARAGGLDQGNIIPNLLDAAAGVGVNGYLFLAGSAINSVKNERGCSDPQLGTKAMEQVLEVYSRRVFADVDSFRLEDLKAYADNNALGALNSALIQRYS